LDKKDVYIHVDPCSWDVDFGPQGVKVLYCNKLKQHMVPPEREKMGRWYSPVYDVYDDEISEEMMPKTCEFCDSGGMTAEEAAEFEEWDKMFGE
jgi:hypothetical protein